MTTLAAFPAIDEDLRGGEAFVDTADRRSSARCWNANSRAPATEAHPFLPQRINFRHEDFTLLKFLETESR